MTAPHRGRRRLILVSGAVLILLQALIIFSGVVEPIPSWAYVPFAATTVLIVGCLLVVLFANVRLWKGSGFWPRTATALVSLMLLAWFFFVWLFTGLDSSGNGAGWMSWRSISYEQSFPSYGKTVYVYRYSGFPDGVHSEVHVREGWLPVMRQIAYLPDGRGQGDLRIVGSLEGDTLSLSFHDWNQKATVVTFNLRTGESGEPTLQ